ncbi:MAG TPA: glycosyltransferase [Solirubrobacteraceae bacterium]
MDAVTVAADSREDLEKLLACEPLRRSFDRLIVVDNMSSDGSAEVARSAGAEVIQVSPRQGYARCVNLAVSHTTGSRFAVLNPDIAFRDEHQLPALETHFDEDDVGLVAPALVLPDGQLQDSARRIPTPLDLVMRRGGIDRRRGEIDSGGDVPWVVGACFVARRAAWEAIGGLDESYPLYFEDVDLCWRLRQAGWKTRLDRTVRVEHKHVAASRKNLLGLAARQHVAGAARFYRTNPRFIWSARLPAVVGPAKVASPARAPSVAAVPAPAAPAAAAPVKPAAVGIAAAAVATPDPIGSLDGPSRWLAGQARLSGPGVDDAHGGRIAAVHLSPRTPTHEGAAARPVPGHPDATRWLPRRAADTALAA